MIERQHMIIRANELARASGGRITAADLAAKLAAEFRHASDEVLDDYCARIVANSIIEPDLPEDSQSEQLALPGLLTGFLRVRNAEGVLEFVQADHATGDEALSAMTAKHERHSTQARRATKKLKEIRVVIGWDGYQRSLPYNDNCQQYRRALQAGSGE